MSGPEGSGPFGSGGAGATFATLSAGDAELPEGAKVPAASDHGPRFAEQGVVGRGGMGEVHLLHDAALGRSLVRKELRADRAASPALRQRFLTEARITAQLAHPGVVPVHDLGVLPDGRPFYTMREVRGLTLGEAIHAVHRGQGDPSRLTGRRLLEVVHRAAETVAYAHSRGIIHRDLKPENIMLGEFGAVLVLDWGLARELAAADDVFAGALSGESVEVGQSLTQAGRILGTPGYLPPEQARGALTEMGPPSDVFALGCVLFEVLTGRAAFEGDVRERVMAVLSGVVPELPGEHPEELVQLCARALQPDPRARFATAEGFAQALDDWLAGARRRERALDAVALADTHEVAWRALLAEAEDLRREAAAVLEPLRSFDPAEAKVPGWRLEDLAEAREGEAELAAARYVSQLHGALQIDPELPEAHARLAAWFRFRHEVSEAAQDRHAAIRAEELLRTHDRGEHAEYLAGVGTLRLQTEPPGGRGRVSRFVLRDRRLVPEEVGLFEASELRAARLPAGSYLVVLAAPGCAPASYPVLLPRGGEWAEAPVRLLPEGSLAPDDCYVPAGPFLSGGDPEAADGLPAARVQVDGFVIKRAPVTNEEYLEFLNDLVARGLSEEAERWAPGSFGRDEDAKQRRFGRTPGGRFVLGREGVEDAWVPRGPVVNVSWRAAAAYCRWRSDREGLEWRLPHSLEWEKAARGVDGRFLPWGDHLEPTWANTVDSHEGRPRLTVVDSHPLDCSVYGVLGLVGNSRDWCLDRYDRRGTPLSEDTRRPASPDEPDDTWRVAKGGASWNGGSLVRPATRFGASPEVGFTIMGFRLCRSV